MGAKKEPRKKDADAKIYSIDDPLNSGSWNCVVAMAVEKTFTDSFVLKAYLEEAINGRRQLVKLINYDTFVMKILNDFARGELRYKYAFLLNFSSVFQEAAGCVSNKIEIPVALLAKVVKALLFYLKEESLARAERKTSGPVDPIQAMAERPANVGGTLGSKSKSKKELTTNEKKKQQQQSGNDKLTLRPPSMSKQDTKLSKRGEGIKEDQCIDDAPDDDFFHLYVLLTGFYHPQFPLELIKAGVPLHLLLCVDTSLSEVKRTDSEHHNKTPKRNSENRTEEIQHFWESFLKVLWDPELSFYFNDTIFQVYVPKKLTCNNLKEFIYGEISYLMYDVSDFNRQLGNYLQHMKLWYVEGESKPKLSERYIMRMNETGDECATAPVILRQITGVVSEEDAIYDASTSASTDYDAIDSVPSEFYVSQSVVTKRGSLYAMSPVWSQLLSAPEDSELLSIYVKVKELDIKYGLEEGSRSESLQTELTVQEERLGSCLDSYETGVFASRWKNIDKRTSSPFPAAVAVDYSLYLLLLTKVLCFYDNTHVSVSFSEKTSITSSRKNFNFKQIENGDEIEMRKPHFTITQGSRNVIDGTPYDMKETSKDFFSPLHLKLVTPEILKACSAPEFRSVLKPNVERSFVSELTYPLEFFKNSKLTLFENLRKFLGEQMFDQVKGYDFFEEVSKTKLLVRESQYASRYNCIDSSYSIIADALFVVFHNRKGSDGIHHETFNGVLKTAVGLRDFYDYILEDEADWFREQEKFLRPRSLTLTNTLSQEGFSYNCTDSDFWLEKSIKYQENLKLGSRRNITGIQTKEKEENEEVDQNDLSSSNSILGEAEKIYSFHGYDVSKAAVQFSGFKTEYHGHNCSMTVELLERLYGDQHLGIHAFLAGHTLHLYSYVCPKPHLDHPYTFHLLLQSGMVVAFSERRIEVLQEAEETIDSSIITADENRKSTTSALSATESMQKTIQIPKTITDNEFAYDMKLSLPNGLKLTTVRKAVKPCYIKQQRLEITRLFLPNGNVVEMTHEQMQILKGDATIVTSYLSNLATEALPDGIATTLENYHITTPEGIACEVEKGRVVSRQKLTLFQNTDLETSTSYFRRGDKTSYMFQKNGTMCVQFKDGTKISTTPFLGDPSEDSISQSAFYDDVSFAIVEMEVTVEHPDFATVIYNSHTQSWKILLPFDTSITTKSDGTYVAQLDGQIELRVDQEQVEMKSSLAERQVPSVTADLTVFSDDNGTPGRIYCKMTDSSGKTFAVEPNAACYILDDGESQSRDGGNSGEDLLNQTEVKLSRDNKYFVVRRDVTGFELFHTEDVRKLMASPTPGMVVFAPEIPNFDFRIFVFIFPASQTTEKRRMWKVQSVLPDPRFVPGTVKTKITTTYGVPPSWIHPYPKQKIKFEIPSRLTCRVFLEINRTDLEPRYELPDCSYCQIEDIVETKFSKIDSNEVQESIKRLSNDDQDMLRDMYILAVREGIKAGKPKPKPEGSEALKRYLAQSERLVALQKFHQNSIRYRIVPNYFEHPIGVSWLILNRILDGLTYPEDHKKKPARSLLPSPRSFKSQSTFSNEEIEYDLQTTSEQSYSDLTCRTNLSLKSAPTVLMSGNLCTCKVRPAAVSESAPIYRMKDRISSESRLEVQRERVCAISSDDWVKPSEKSAGGKPVLMTLSNLMSLGLI